MVIQQNHMKYAIKVRMFVYTLTSPSICVSGVFSSDYFISTPKLMTEQKIVSNNVCVVPGSVASARCTAAMAITAQRSGSVRAPAPMRRSLPWKCRKDRCGQGRRGTPRSPGRGFPSPGQVFWLGPKAAERALGHDDDEGPALRMVAHRFRKADLGLPHAFAAALAATMERQNDRPLRLSLRRHSSGR